MVVTRFPYEGCLIIGLHASLYGQFRWSQGEAIRTAAELQVVCSSIKLQIGADQWADQ